MSSRVICSILTLFLFIRGECQGGVSVNDAETSLASELAGNIDKSRLDEIEAELQPMFTAMPKHEGQLGHQAVRYMLHRLFVERHSWYVRGLEPGDNDKPLYLEGEWVPTYLQDMLEERLAGRGINLSELAALAASIEDLVHKEAVGNLEQVYRMHNLPVVGVTTPAQINEAVSTYMMFYLQGGKFSLDSGKDVKAEKERFKVSYADWNVVETWFRELTDRHLKPLDGGGLTFATMKKLIADMSEKFGFFNDRECHDLKKTMGEIRDGQSGRVRLSDFYSKSLYSHWQFNEKPDYLRAIGALDEVSDPKEPRVILTNYAMSRSNCLESSSLYSVCCRNECEDLMGKLESEIAAPTAPPARIVELVQSMSSDTVVGPRQLSPTLLRRLDQISSQNSGGVPLHGRLFAQWMHHTFPRECPFPHEAGIASPHTPDEWLEEAGHPQTEDGHRASEEHMRSHIDDVGVPHDAPRVEDLDHAELHWSDAEDILFAAHSEMAVNKPRAARNQARSFQSVVVLLGLLAAAGCGAYLVAGGSALDAGSLLPGASGTSRSEKARRRIAAVSGGAALILSGVALVDALGLLDRRAFAVATGLAALSVCSSGAMKRMAAPSAVGKCKGYDLWEGEHDKLA